MWIDVIYDAFLDVTVERRDYEFQENEGIDDITELDDFSYATMPRRSCRR